jgi:phosphatidate cytidylyltransferase
VSDLGARIAVAIPAIAFAIFIVVQGSWWFAAGAILLGLACLHELYFMLASVRPARLAGFLALIGLGLAAMLGGPEQVLLVAVASVGVTFLLTLAGPSIAGGVFGIAAVLLGVFWVGLAIAHAIMLRELDHGGAALAAVLAGTFAGDTGAYFGGKALGRHRMAPTISPNKTWEGLAFGIFTAILAVWIVNWYQDFIDTPQALILGAVVAVVAPVGDLFESFIKRDVGTKDAGSLFGAHGGALDRLDAVLFTLVAGYYVWQALLPM